MRTVLAALLVLLAGCGTYYKLPRPAEMSEYPFGCLTECYTKDGTRYLGELISVERDSLFVLIYKTQRKAGPRSRRDSTFNPGRLYVLAKNNINQAKVLVSLSGDKSGKLTLWATLLNLGTITHGTLLLFTLPVNAVVSADALGKVDGMNYVDYPTHMDWEHIHKFARFPQGIPEGVERRKLE